MRRPGRCAVGALVMVTLAHAGPLGLLEAWAGSRGLAPGGLHAGGPQGLATERPRAFDTGRLADPPVGRWLAAGGLERKDDGSARPREFAPLSAERAQLLLRSLTVPGWGQATLERNTSATAFGLAELGIWATFTAFRIQVQLRRQASERTALLLAGIDLEGRDEEFRRIVGAFLSSDEYNRLVVYRDAANLYYDNPALYRQYIAEHQLGGDDRWEWANVESLLRYRAQRRNITQASQRANTVLAVAIANRLLSALHVARAAGRPQGGEPPRSWNIEVAPTDPDDPTAYRLGVRARF